MTRTRTSTIDRSPVSASYIFNQYGTGGTEPNTYPILFDDVEVSRGEGSQVYGGKSMVDVVTANFKALQGAGHIINNPMVQSNTMYSENLGDIDIDLCRGESDFIPLPLHYNYYGYRIHGKIGATYFFDRADSSNFVATPDINVDHLIQLAVTNAHANVDNSQGNILETIAESGKSLDSLILMFKKALRIFRAVKRVDMRLLKKEITAAKAADLYMELRYGLRPIYFDVKNINAALQAKTSKTSFRSTSRGFASETKTASDGDFVITFDEDLELDCSNTTTRSVNVRAGVLTQVDCVTNANIWGFDKPIETAWELVPFSFIVDWFLNVGQVIASFTPEFGTKSLACWAVVEDISVSTATVNRANLVSPSYWNFSNNANISGCGITKTVFRKERTVEPLRSVWPTYNVRLDPYKILDIAIITSGLSKFKARR